MRLRKAHKEKLLEWIAEGLRTDEINARAKTLENPFTVTRQHVDYYRKKKGVDINKLRLSSEHSALNSGLAIAANRVALLKRIAERITDDLFNKELFWTEMAKGIGTGADYERIDYETFNAAEVSQLRGVLDDIAQEVGERIQRKDITSKGEKLQRTISLEDISNDDLNQLAEIIRNNQTANVSGD